LFYRCKTSKTIAIMLGSDKAEDLYAHHAHHVHMKKNQETESQYAAC